MKTTKLFLTIILLFTLKTTMAQETWYNHNVVYFETERPNLNSVLMFNLSPGITCGDSGYVAE